MTYCNKCGSDRCYLSGHFYENVYHVKCMDCNHTFHYVTPSTKFNHLKTFDQCNCPICNSGYTYKQGIVNDKTRMECNKCNYSWYVYTENAKSHTPKLKQNCLYCNKQFIGRAKLYCSIECKIKSNTSMYLSTKIP